MSDSLNDIAFSIFFFPKIDLFQLQFFIKVTWRFRKQEKKKKIEKLKSFLDIFLINDLTKA